MKKGERKGARNCTQKTQILVSFWFRYSLVSLQDPDTFEKYCDTPPTSIAILLQKYALPLAESSIYATNLYHDTPPICIAIFLQKYSGQGSLEHSQKGVGKGMDKKVTKNEKKVTKKWPKTREKGDLPLFGDPLLRDIESEKVTKNDKGDRTPFSDIF